MPFHVRDPEADALVRAFANEKGVGITEAIKIAIRGQMRRESEDKPLIERIREFQKKVLSRPATGLEADKAFYDSLSGED